MLDQRVRSSLDQLADTHLRNDQQHRPRPDGDAHGEDDCRYRLQPGRWPAGAERLREHDVERDADEHERQNQCANAVTAADERAEPKPRPPAWTHGLSGWRLLLDSHGHHPFRRRRITALATPAAARPAP